MPEDRLYFRQLLAGRDFATADPIARQMVNFVYLVGDRETGEAVVIDPAYDIDGLLEISPATAFLDMAMEADAKVVKGALPSFRCRQGRPSVELTTGHHGVANHLKLEAKAITRDPVDLAR